MKIVTFAILFLAIHPLLIAQAPVKKDLLKMAGQTPAPPASAKDAYAKVAAPNEKGEISVSAVVLFAPIEGEARAVEAEYVASRNSGGPPPGMTPEMMKQMSDPEMQKKMKSMSSDEKMKMAMEMSKATNPGAPVPAADSPEVVAALQEWSKIVQTMQKDFDAGVKIQQEQTKQEEEYKKSQAEIAKWEGDEIARLPRISSGEMSAPDPAKVREVKLKAADKHIALANTRLEQVRSDWRASIEKTKTKYGAFNGKLIAANYAADSKNFGTRKTLSDGQMMILEDIKRQIAWSRKAWEESASWEARKVEIEKQKVK